MISLSSFCWINRYAQSLLSAGRLLRCMKNQMERVIGPSVRSSKHPSRRSSCSTFFTADLSSLCAVHSCQKLYLHILCHGWEAVLPVIQPAPAYCPVGLSRPAWPVFLWPCPFSLPLLTSFQRMASLHPEPACYWLVQLAPCQADEWTDRSLSSSSSSLSQSLMLTLLHHASTDMCLLSHLHCTLVDLPGPGVPTNICL